jgi:hypothetical protein
MLLSFKELDKIDLKFNSKDNKTITFDWSFPRECYDRLLIYCVRNGTNMSTLASMNMSRTQGVCMDLLPGTSYLLLSINERYGQRLLNVIGPYCTDVGQIKEFSVNFLRYSLNASISYVRPVGNYEKVFLCFAEKPQSKKCIDAKNQEIIPFGVHGVEHGKEYLFYMESCGCNNDSITTSTITKKYKTGII